MAGRRPSKLSPGVAHYLIAHVVNRDVVLASLFVPNWGVTFPYFFFLEMCGVDRPYENNHQTGTLMHA